LPAIVYTLFLFSLFSAFHPLDPVPGPGESDRAPAVLLVKR
jgi:hypothetical protein